MRLDRTDTPASQQPSQPGSTGAPPAPAKPRKPPFAQRVGRKLDFLNWVAIVALIASSLILALHHLGGR